MRASQATVEAHEPLRSTWSWQNGEPMCQVLPADCIESSVSILDQSTNPHAIFAATSTSTTMTSASPPHMRHGLLRRHEDDNLWAFATHHMAADAILLKHYAETFRVAYAGSVVRDAPTMSTAYALTQREWLRSPAAQAEFEWWLPRLTQIEASGLPVAPPRTAETVVLERQELRLSSHVRIAALNLVRSFRAPIAALFFAANARVCATRGHPTTAIFINVPGRVEQAPDDRNAEGAKQLGVRASG